MFIKDMTKVSKTHSNGGLFSLTIFEDIVLNGFNILDIVGLIALRLE